MAAHQVVCVGLKSLHTRDQHCVAGSRIRTTTFSANVSPMKRPSAAKVVMTACPTIRAVDAHTFRACAAATYKFWRLRSKGACQWRMQRGWSPCWV